MKSIALDFNNRKICIINSAQETTELRPDVGKNLFHSFIPAKYRDYNSFTWNFESETFSVNQDYILHEGCIMTKDCFVPQCIIPMSGLRKKYNEFIAIIGCEELF